MVLHITNLNISSNQERARDSHTIIQDLHFTIQPGEMVGLVGESGSGKSVTSSAILGLLPNSLTIVSGEITMHEVPLRSLSEKEKRRFRGKEIAYLFQNYSDSFTPFLRIGKQMVEAIRSHEKIGKSEAKQLALQWLERVNLPAERVYQSYPFQLSGGQIQRAAIAVALMMKPSLIIADEPTTALDVLTGERVLDLLGQLQNETNCAVLLISHNLRHVLNRTNRMAVMYGGHLIEMGATESIRNNPKHPYTQMLLKARPTLTYQKLDTLPEMPGEPGMISERGCPFLFRCPYSKEICKEKPILSYISEAHMVACHLSQEGEVSFEADSGSQTSYEKVSGTIDSFR
ncbi:ABC transporter ATP-binding protein [Risungbinella massiliensis]|uniref:ABC transporter ATP-binding protein n=1 Tax=Risungbinella massiliensis TaxID=1329796 RepID=UPI0006998D7D|nr:ABC transporter ATP-binding protein [Risungbinella massiliensis]